MSMNINVQENWTIEPELSEIPPRRIVLSEYPDLNRPNPLVIYGTGGVLGVGGFVLLIVGLTGSNVLFTILGIVIALIGAGVVGFLGPYLIRRHLSRGEHLVKNGVPVMARLLAADNMSGDYSSGRSVTYQVALPNGEMMHRQVNADDRLLPRKIPANATALLDMESNDVELYCALPYRVQPNPALMAAKTAAREGSLDGMLPSTGVANPGKMETINVLDVPQGGKREKPQEQEAPKPTQTTSGGLPWE